MAKKKPVYNMTFLELIASIKTTDIDPIIELLERMKDLAPNIEVAHSTLTEMRTLIFGEDYDDDDED